MIVRNIEGGLLPLIKCNTDGIARWTLPPKVEDETIHSTKLISYSLTKGRVFEVLHPLKS